MANDTSVLQDIRLIDLWGGQLTTRTQEGIAQRIIDPRRFRQCFKDYPDVLVQIGKLSGAGDCGFALNERERDYALGQGDLFKQIVTLSALDLNGVKDESI